jgi:DNA-binding transcriptional regulator GbsR (MarR family)
MAEGPEARRLLVEALGIQSDFWGLGRITGEIYAVLYTAPSALSLADLSSALGVTKGAVSVAIRRLEDLRMVRRQYQPGDRRVFFVATVDFWAIAREFLRRRYEPAFASAFQLVAEAIQVAEHGDDPELAARLRALQHFYNLLDQLAAVLVAIDPSAIPHLVETLMPLIAQRGGTPS